MPFDKEILNKLDAAMERTDKGDAPWAHIHEHNERLFELTTKYWRMRDEAEKRFTPEQVKKLMSLRSDDRWQWDKEFHEYYASLLTKEELELSVEYGELWHTRPFALWDDENNEQECSEAWNKVMKNELKQRSE